MIHIVGNLKRDKEGVVLCSSGKIKGRQKCVLHVKNLIDVSGSEIAGEFKLS